MARLSSEPFFFNSFHVGDWGLAGGSYRYCVVVDTLEACTATVGQNDSHQQFLSSARTHDRIGSVLHRVHLHDGLPALKGAPPAVEEAGLASR